MTEGRAEGARRGKSERSDIWERVRPAEGLEECRLAAGGGREAESEGSMSSSPRESQSSLEGNGSEELRLSLE